MSHRSVHHEGVTRLPNHWGRESDEYRRARYLVSQLVGDHDGNPLLVRGSRDALLVEQGRLPVGDQAPVLHGTGGKVGDGNHVLLGQRELHIEVVLKELEYLWSNITSILCLVKG